MRDLNEQIELLKIKSADVKLETNRHVTGRNVQAEPIRHSGQTATLTRGWESLSGTGPT